MKKLTVEELEFIKNEYLEDPSKATVDFLAEKFELSTRSIVSRLNHMGVYKKPGYTTKSGEKPVSKDKIVELIAKTINEPSEKLEGLEKAPKSALRIILSNLDPDSDIYFHPGYRNE